MNLQSRYGAKRAFISDITRVRRDTNRVLDSFYAGQGKQSSVRALNRLAVETARAVASAFGPPLLVHAVAISDGGDEKRTMRRRVAAVRWVARRIHRSRHGRDWISFVVLWPRKAPRLTSYLVVVGRHEKQMSLVRLFTSDFA